MHGCCSHSGAVVSGLGLRSSAVIRQLHASKIMSASPRAKGELPVQSLLTELYTVIIQQAVVQLRAIYHGTLLDPL